MKNHLKLFLVFGIGLLTLSCNRTIYEFHDGVVTERIELNKKGYFIYSFSSSENEFKTQGTYENDSTTLLLVFNPVIQENLKYLPINEAKVEINCIPAKAKEYLYTISIKDDILLENIWGINISASSKDTLLFKGLSDKFGQVSFLSDHAVDEIQLYCKDCVPVNIRIKSEGDCSIDIIWKQVRGSYGRGHLLPRRGPRKEMEIIFSGDKIVKIHQNDLDDKIFILK